MRNMPALRTKPLSRTGLRRPELSKDMEFIQGALFRSHDIIHVQTLECILKVALPSWILPCGSLWSKKGRSAGTRQVRDRCKVGPL